MAKAHRHDWEFTKGERVDMARCRACGKVLPACLARSQMALRTPVHQEVKRRVMAKGERDGVRRGRGRFGRARF